MMPRFWLEVQILPCRRPLISSPKSQNNIWITFLPLWGMIKAMRYFQHFKNYLVPFSTWVTWLGFVHDINIINIPEQHSSISVKAAPSSLKLWEFWQSKIISIVPYLSFHPLCESQNWLWNGIKVSSFPSMHQHQYSIAIQIFEHWSKLSDSQKLLLSSFINEFWNQI